MSRLLQGPSLGAPPRPLGAPDPAADPFTRRQVEEASAAAYERGLADGRRAAAEEAAAAAREASARAAEAVRAAAADVLEQLRVQREAQALADTGLAARIAEAVLGREPHDGGQALLERCREALAALDDAPLTLRANPADAEVLRAGLAAGPGSDVDVVADASLAPGEATLAGRWGRADLTQEAVWDLVRAALEADDA